MARMGVNASAGGGASVTRGWSDILILHLIAVRPWHLIRPRQGYGVASAAMWRHFTPRCRPTPTSEVAAVPTGTRPRRGLRNESVAMANKSARKEDRKKQVKSLKEKRADKKAKQATKNPSLIPPTGH